jgi:sulfur-oxidizing protein SoxY
MSLHTIASQEATRRTALRLLAGLGLYGITLPAFAADAADAPGWPATAFKAKSQDDALAALYKGKLEMSKDVSIETPEIAENGAVVPVSVSTTLAGVTSISILVPENPFTLAASYKLEDKSMAMVSCRLKMAKTTQVIAIVESGGKLYATSSNVKVTLGGCGG